MQAHLSIGLVFAGAWRLFRRRYFTIFLLSLMQSAWIFLLSFRLELATYVAPIRSLLIPEIWLGTWVATGVLFLLTSMGIMVVDGNRTAHTSLGRTLLYRTLPALVDTLLLFMVLAGLELARYHADTADDILSSSILIYSMPVSVLKIAIFAVHLAILPTIFVTLPASVNERSWPLQAIWHSYQLTRGQHWRVVVIILILLATCLVGFIAYEILMAELVWSGGYVSSDDMIVKIWCAKIVGGTLSCLLVWPFTLTVTLIIASTYQQLIGLKNLSRATAEFD